MDHRCLICKTPLPAPVFAADNMPFGAQSMPTAEEAAAGKDRGISLSLHRCPHCGLVQFDCEPVPYYRQVIRAVGLSTTMQELRRQDYRKLISEYGTEGKRWIECGCGNGDFLKVLAEFPVEIWGTEADAGNVAAARASLGDRAHILQFFPEQEDLPIPGAPFDVFLSLNFLEHQPDPVSMLRCMHRNLADGGAGLITVPSFEYILQKGRYYELVRDHIANYDLESLAYLCRISGFEVLEQGMIGIGDTLRVIVRKTAGFPSEIPGTDRPEEDRYLCLKENYTAMREQIAAYMEELSRQGRSIAMWGASHQGFTIAATTALKDHVHYIIDSAAFKQGRCAPASHLPIVAPDHYAKDPVDVILIAAPGYIREIEASIRSRFADTPAGVPAICDVLDLTER